MPQGHPFKGVLKNESFVKRRVLILYQAMYHIAFRKWELQKCYAAIPQQSEIFEHKKGKGGRLFFFGGGREGGHQAELSHCSSWTRTLQAIKQRSNSSSGYYFTEISELIISRIDHCLESLNFVLARKGEFGVIHELVVCDFSTGSSRYHEQVSMLHWISNLPSDILLN